MRYHAAYPEDCIKGVMTLLFYDFEVFKCDWLVVVMDTDTKKTTVIINDKEELTEFSLSVRKIYGLDLTMCITTSIS